MNAARLGKQFGRIVLGEEEVVDDGCDLNSKPLSKLSVLNAEILDSFLLLDLFEEYCQAIAFYYITSEPESVSKIPSTIIMSAYCSIYSSSSAARFLAIS